MNPEGRLHSSSARSSLLPVAVLAGVLLGGAIVLVLVMAPALLTRAPVQLVSVWKGEWPQLVFPPFGLAVGVILGATLKLVLSVRPSEKGYTLAGLWPWAVACAVGVALFAVCLLNYFDESEGFLSMLFEPSASKDAVAITSSTEDQFKFLKADATKIRIERWLTFFVLECLFLFFFGSMIMDYFDDEPAEQPSKPAPAPREEGRRQHWWRFMRPPHYYNIR